MSGGGDKEVDRIFVGGLPPHANEAEVEDIFAKYGRIEQIQIRRKAAGGLPFAFVRFASPRDAEEAVREKHGRDYKGNPLRVEICEGGRMNQNQQGYDREDISPPAAYRGFRGRPFRGRGFYQRDDYYRGPPRSDDRDRGGYERRERDYDNGDDYYDDRERDRGRPPDRRSPSAAGRRLPYERPGQGDRERAPPRAPSPIRTISRDRAPDGGIAAGEAAEAERERAAPGAEGGSSRLTPPPAADTRRISSARERDDRVPGGDRGGRGSPSKSRSLSLSSHSHSRSPSSSRSRSARSRSRSGSRTRGRRERSMTPDLNAKIAASSKAVAAGAAAASLASGAASMSGTSATGSTSAIGSGALAGSKSTFSTPLFPAGGPALRSSNVNTNMSAAASASLVAGSRVVATSGGSATLGAPDKPAALFGSAAAASAAAASAALANSASANAAGGAGKPAIVIAKQVGTGTIEAAIWRAHLCVGSGTVSIPAAAANAAIGAPGTMGAGLGSLIGLTPAAPKPGRADAWASVGADDLRMRGQHRSALKRCPSEPGPAFRELTTLDDPPPPPPPPSPPRVEEDYEVNMSEEDERRGRGRGGRRGDYDEDDDRRGRPGSRSDSRRRDRERRGLAGRRRERDGLKHGRRSGSRSLSPAPARERRFRDEREHGEHSEDEARDRADGEAREGGGGAGGDRERSLSRSRSPRSRSAASRSRSPYSDEGSRRPSRSRSHSGSRTPSPSAKSRSRSRGAERGPGAPGERGPSGRYSPTYGARGGGGSRPRGGRPERRMELRLLVTGLPSTASWQDLKDHMRKAGEVNYAEVFDNGRGIVEYQRAEDVTESLRKLNGSKFQSFRNETSYIQVIDDREEVERLSSLPPPGRGRFIPRGSPRGNFEPRGPRYEGDRGGYYRGGGGMGGRGRGYRDYSDRGGGYRDYGYQQRDYNRDRPPTRFNRDEGYVPRGRGGRPRGDYGRDRDDYYDDYDRAPRRRLSGDGDRSPPSKRARSSSRSPGRTPSPIPVSPRDSAQATSN